MRHRFHSICPYFAMFPETFVEKHLAATPFGGIVFDPFCRRGTTVLESLIPGTGRRWLRRASCRRVCGRREKRSTDAFRGL